MTRPAPITKADLVKYPHLNAAIKSVVQQNEPIKPVERAGVFVPPIKLPDPDRLEVGGYGFMAGVLFMGVLGIVAGVV